MCRDARDDILAFQIVLILIKSDKLFTPPALPQAPSQNPGGKKTFQDFVDLIFNAMIISFHIPIDGRVSVSKQNEKSVWCFHVVRIN